jgi:glutathione S-transferase
MEESALIWDYLDQLDGSPSLGMPADAKPWEADRLEALARSLLDGVAVWGRELARPENERSPTVIQHEARRSERLTDVWEAEIGSPLMQGALNRAQATLACALGFEARIPGFRWREEHPRLRAWFDRIAARPSFAATTPATTLNGAVTG